MNAAISAALINLPSNIIPPSYHKQNPAARPILYFALTSHDLPLSTLDEYGETTIAQRLSMVTGVAQVAVYGSQKYAVRIQLDPASSPRAALGSVRSRPRSINQNVLLPTGVIYGPHQTLTVHGDRPALERGAVPRA